MKFLFSLVLLLPLFMFLAMNREAIAQSLDFSASTLPSSYVAGTGLFSVDEPDPAMKRRKFIIDSTIVSLQVAVPTNSTAACDAGQHAEDANFYYVCVAPNTWRRAPLQAW